MNFDWTKEEQHKLEEIKEVFDPKALSALQPLQEASLEENRKIIKRFLKKLAPTGYLKLEMGPQRRDQTMTLLAAQQQVATADNSLFVAVEVTARLFGTLIRSHGSERLKEKLLPRLERGQLIGALAMSEPPLEEQTETTERSPNRWQTRATVHKNRYLLNGSKSLVTNAPIADWLAVVGMVEQRPAVFVISSQTRGLTIGPRLRTLGYQGLCVSAIELNDVKVDNVHMLGPFTDDEPLNFLISINDLLLAMASIGLMGRSLAHAKRHAHNHRSGGKPIYAYQEVRFKLAEMLTLYQAAELLVYRAGWFHRVSDREAETLIRAAKVFCAEACETVTSICMQILASQGYLWGNPVEQGYRDAKYAGLASTTTERARMSIADDLLQRYRK